MKIGRFLSGWGGGILAALAIVVAGVIAWWMISPQADAPEPQMPAEEVAAAPAETGDETAPEAVPDEAETAEAPAPAAELETAEAPDTPALAPLVPSFDVVRIKPDGSALVAGRAEAGAKVSVLVDGAPVAETNADAGTGFVAMFTLPPVQIDRVMTLEAQLDDGTRLSSDMNVIVEGVELPTVVAEATPAPESPAAPTPPAADVEAMGAPAATGEPGAQPAPETSPETELAPAGAPAPAAATDMVEAPEAAPEPEMELAMAPEAEPAPDADTPPAAATVPQPMPEPEAPAAPDGLDAPELAAPEPAPLAPAEPAPAATAETGAPVVATAEPTAPRILLAGPDGVRVLQDTGPNPQLSIDAIAYDSAGEVALSGRGEGEQILRIYVDNAPVGTVEVGPEGEWHAPLPEIDAGVYTLRVDAISPEGTVMRRVETPFKREDAAVLAAAEAAAAGRPLAAITVQPGHTLWAIAKGRYGEGLKYWTIFDANRDQIRDPDWIYPGQVFTLPDKAQ